MGYELINKFRNMVILFLSFLILFISTLPFFITVDATVTTVRDILFTSRIPNANRGFYTSGDTITASVTFHEAVDVTGTPQLTIRVGEENRIAQYKSGSGSTILNFEYEVVAEDYDLDGISIPAGSIELNGGTIKNGTDDATLTYTQVNNVAAHRVIGGSIVEGEIQVAPSSDRARLTFTPNVTGTFVIELRDINSDAHTHPDVSIDVVKGTQVVNHEIADIDSGSDLYVCLYLQNEDEEHAGSVCPPDNDERTKFETPRSIGVSLIREVIEGEVTDDVNPLVGKVIVAFFEPVGLGVETWIWERAEPTRDLTLDESWSPLTATSITSYLDSPKRQASSTYRIAEDDEGYVIRATARYGEGESVAQVSSTPTPTIVRKPEVTIKLSPQGPYSICDTVTAEVTSDYENEDDIIYTYSWRASKTNDASTDLSRGQSRPDREIGENSNTYTIQEKDISFGFSDDENIEDCEGNPDDNGGDGYFTFLWLVVSYEIRGTGISFSAAAGSSLEYLNELSFTGPSSVNEGDRTGDYTINLDDPALGDTIITYSFSGSANAGTDYILPNTNSITIPAGETSATLFSIQTLEDNNIEANESITISLGETFGNKSVTTIINNDDFAPTASTPVTPVSPPTGNDDVDDGDGDEDTDDDSDEDGEVAGETDSTQTDASQEENRGRVAAEEDSQLSENGDDADDDGNESISIFRTWWFWLIILLIILGIGFGWHFSRDREVTNQT